MSVTFFDVPNDPKNARAAIVPIPYEKTTSYGQGACGGPEAILDASNQVELYDEVLGDQPCRVGLCAEPIGDPEEVCSLNPSQMIDRYRKIVGWHLDNDRFPVVLGGEHTVALAPFSAAVKRHHDLHVLFLDAHADLRHSYLGDPYSHACVARRMAVRAPIVQVGTRSYDREQLEALRQLNVKMLHAHEIRRGTGPIDFAERYLGDPVYLTIDLDVFNPAEMPAVGTPEPGGLDWYEIDRLLAWLFANRTVIAMDIAELAPLVDCHAPEFFAARLLYRCIGRRLLDQ